jgi:hypothetical protein
MVVATDSAPATPSAETATPTLPVVLIPPDAAAAATVEQVGVRVTIELERNPMPAGEPTWIMTTVTNTGDDGLVYQPCGEAVPVGGVIADTPWRTGANQPEPAMTWKSYLLGQQGVRSPDRLVLFLPEGSTGSSSGCGDIGYVERLAPGGTLRERAIWNGLTFRLLAPPPTSRVDLVGSFPFYRGAPRDEVPADDRHQIDVHLDAWIAGGPDPWLDPAEVADIAVRDPRLTALFASRELHNGNEGVLRFDATTGLYWVGMLESGSLPVSRAHLLFIDARTGEVVGFVERDWDYRVDDYP